MALIFEKEVGNTGITANYHRIEGLYLNFNTNDNNVRIESYLNEESFNLGKQSIETTMINIESANISDKLVDIIYKNVNVKDEMINQNNNID